MAGWEALAGAGSVAEQLAVWGALQQLIGVLLGPTFELIQESVNADHPVFPLTPADLASAVVRNFLTLEEAQAEAAKSGIDPARFVTLKQLSGDAPGPQQLAEMLRRKLIPPDGTGPESTSFVQGIAEGRLADKWAEPFKGLAQIWPTPNDALDALLEGQLDEATAKALYVQLGGDLDFFQWLFDTRGNAPTPMEALQMANRKIIPWDGEGPGVVSFHQAFLEGPWRNKWEGPFRRLGVYVPPPRTVTTLLAHGVISEDQARAWFEDTGMTPDAAEAYVKSATVARTATHRSLTESNIGALYTERLITAAQAEAMLADIGYGAEDAAYILQSWDFARARAAYQQAVNRVGSYYTGRKIDRASAVDALKSLDVPADAQTELLSVWDTELAVTVKEPSPAQVADLVKWGVKDQAWGLDELGRLGYTPHGAWVFLSAHLHTAAGPEPALASPPGMATPPA